MKIWRSARDDQALLAGYFSSWSLSKVLDGAWVAWPAGERIELPDFQLRVEDRDAATRTFEVFLNDRSGGAWHSRRHAQITRALKQLIGTTADGIPFLAPEVQLSFKAKYHRPKDEHDFAIALPLLSVAQRAWLRNALELAYAGDAWLARL